MEEKCNKFSNMIGCNFSQIETQRGRGEFQEGVIVKGGKTYADRSESEEILADL